MSARVTVTLLPDPRRARYEYELELETIGPVLARYWCYHLPAGPDEVGRQQSARHEFGGGEHREFPKALPRYADLFWRFHRAQA